MHDINHESIKLKYLDQADKMLSDSLYEKKISRLLKRMKSTAI
jgi:hypothetical protein